MTNAEMKPCKECNHDGLLCQDDVGWFVRCEVDMCDNFSGYFDTPDEAISAWNRRAK
jgi:hypothetical protein